MSKYNTNKLPLSQSYQNIMELMNNDDNIETDYVGESLYSSPEQNKGNGVSKKSDIYSVGLVLMKCANVSLMMKKEIKELIF